MEKPDWDTYFMKICDVIKTRSSCITRQIGAVIIKENRIISTGYNGTPTGIKNCNEGGCERCSSNPISGENIEKCTCSHAEENAITQAARNGIAIKDSFLYTSMMPCTLCSKMIINAGIKKIIYRDDYKDNVGHEMLKQCNIEIKKFLA